VPFSAALVVKKGSNTLATISSGMPQPVSATRNATNSPVRPSRASAATRETFSAEIDSRPPSGMASRALSTRLTKASSISDLSTRTGQIVAGTSIASVMFTCSEPDSTSRMPVTVSAGLSTVGLSG